MEKLLLRGTPFPGDGHPCPRVQTRGMRASQRTEFPGLRQKSSRMILQKELIIAGLSRHSAAIQRRRFPDFTFYGDMRGKDCRSLLKSGSV